LKSPSGKNSFFDSLKTFRMDEKQVFEDSANETPKKDDSDRAIEEEGGEAYGEVGHSRPGFTKLDRRDMYRMGKIQELKVCYHVVDRSS
jgi:hypothetical protein